MTEFQLEPEWTMTRYDYDYDKTCDYTTIVPSKRVQFKSKEDNSSSYFERLK